jgi:hypothetical protein
MIVRPLVVRISGARLRDAQFPTNIGGDDVRRGARRTERSHQHEPVDEVGKLAVGDTRARRLHR